MNQQSGQFGQQLHFSPVAQSFTSMGTTATYCIQPTGQVYGGYSHPNQQPTVYAGQFNQPQAFSGQNQWNQMPSSMNYFQGQGQVSGQFGQWSQYSGFPQPSIDISETSSDIIVSAYAPNLDERSLRLNVTDDSLSISGTTWMGNQPMMLNRSVALPTSVRAESVDANLQSGVLEIRLPKSEKHSRKRHIVHSENQQQQ